MNKLVDQYNNTYQRSVDKKSVDADYSDSAQEIESVYKAPKLKFIFLVKVTLKIGQEKD